MSPVRRFLTLFTVAILIIWVTLAIIAYDSLPATLAMHFGPSGRADGFATKSIGSWFMLTMVGVSTSIMILVLAQMAHTKPDIFNVPGKLTLLSLPPHTQSPFLEQLAIWMTTLSASMVLVFAAIQYDMYSVAGSAQRGLSPDTWLTMAIALGGNLIATPIWLFRFRRAVLATAAAVAKPARAPRSS